MSCFLLSQGNRFKAPKFIYGEKRINIFIETPVFSPWDSLLSSVSLVFCLLS